MSADLQVIVIGAGIAGASTAFALARRGIAVTIIDDGAAGQATAASAGIILPWSTDNEGAFYELYAAGAAFYPQLLELLADAGVTRTDYRRTGGLVVNADPAKLDAVQQRVIARKATAGEVVGDIERLDNAAARELFPPLGPDLDAVFISGGGRVDGRTMRDALLQAAVGSGARRLTGRATVERAADDHDRPRVRLAGELLTADAVVVTAGAWSRDLLNAYGYVAPVQPQKGQISQLRVSDDTTRWPTVHPISHHYLVAFDEGRLAVGATRETGSGFDTRITAAGQLRVLRDALSIAPGLADATLIETRVGLRPLADDLPVAGAVPESPGLYVATGYGAGGLTMGPVIGDAVARSILGEDAREIAAITPVWHS
ncbi:NAD(P)/FAD-dependent oxidoreductase [Microlunatus soli]|uniref:D-amino-acid dehydrogenase n=1 Tax=Microlunatus soli TaxID=630515 RepID=A0A1H1Y5S2_9ACTN|nr:FAD-dependent oxidoreductase [Microlunatus soli]SDT16579.1 D-amino-acid dehydrogenase [Microlunatus soli]